jgi:hypothetical protein
MDPKLNSPTTPPHTRRQVGLAWCLILLAGLTILIWLQHYAPFQASTIAVYGGGMLVLTGFATLVKPLRFLGIVRRKTGLMMAGVGVAIFLSGLFWPASPVRSGRSASRIDDFLPEYTYSEYHRIVVRATPDRVMAAVRKVRLVDMPAAVLLIRLRGLAGGKRNPREDLNRPLLELFNHPGSGFLVLDDSRPDEYVCGMIGRPWTSDPPPVVRNGVDFLAFAAPDHVKVAINIHLIPLGGERTELTSETRILGTDRRADRIFGCYWRIIYPGSAIIRRVWLDAIAVRAEQPATL